MTSDRSTVRRDHELHRAWRALRGQWLAVAGLGALANLLLLTPTLYMLQVYDRVLVSRSELTLLAVSCVAIGLFVVMAGVETLRARVLVALGLRLERALAPRVFEAGLQASLASGGPSGPRPLADLIHLRQFATGAGMLALLDLPWLPVHVAALWLLHPWLGLMALAFAALQCVIAVAGHHRIAPQAAAAGGSGDAASAFLRTKMQGADAIESMGMLGALWRRYQTLHARHAGDESRLQSTTHRMTAIGKFVRYAQQSMALGMGALLVIHGSLSMGAMIAANVLTTRALAPIDQLVGTWRGLATARGAWRRLEALLDRHPVDPSGDRDAAAAKVPSNASSSPAARGALDLRGVEVTAPGGDRPILHGLDLTLAPGSVTVLVGPSGSGKSTLARVIAGAWPVTAGERRLDGAVFDPWAGAPAAGGVGYLSQEVELFEGTIAENIARLGEVDAPAVIAAARRVGLHDAILRLPRGYDTPLGDDVGPTLSGGMQQRVALARAIHGDPALVVLDEPNAHLDEAGEAALATLLTDLKAAGRTVLVVTHRPGVLALADRLVVLRDGRIEHDGAPAEIVARVRAAALAARSALSAPPAAPPSATPVASSDATASAPTASDRLPT